METVWIETFDGMIALHNLRNAFRFINASLKLILKPPRLLKPWLIFLAVGAGILIVGLIPLSAVIGLMGLFPLGLLLIGFFSLFLLAALLIWAEISTLLIIPPFALRSGSGAKLADPPSQVFKQHWQDILIQSLLLPTPVVIDTFQHLFNPKKASQNPWLEARYLLTPIIALENLSFSEAVERLKEMIQNNLLRFRPGLVRVRLVTWLTTGMMILIGSSLALIIGLNIAPPLESGPWRLILALSLSWLVLWVFTSLGLAFSAFLRACYHTALMEWVQNVEKARSTGDPDSSGPPEILGKVLSTK